MNCARCDYYTNLIAENSLDHIPPNDLANNFDNYFIQKIDGITKSLDALKPLGNSDSNDGVCANDNGACPDSGDVRADSVEPCASQTFANFKSLTQGQVAELIRTAGKKLCPLDPIPKSVVLQVLDDLLPVITSMINTLV